MRDFALLIRITRSHLIARRYFVVNGFDGALTMLGIIIGFYFSDDTSIPIVINAGLGAAIALGMSGFSSAYISEAAERQQELKSLETAMVRDLTTSAHGKAARLIPALIALVNGLSPLLFSLLIISPLWIVAYLPKTPLEPLQLSIVVALVIIFLLGTFLAKVSGRHWVVSGLRTLIIALATCGIIYLMTAH